MVLNFNDLGFNLKKNAQSWVLEDIATKRTVAATTAEEIEKSKKANAGVGFGDLLSQVTSDPDLVKKTNVSKKETVADNNTKKEVVETKAVETKVEEVSDNDTLPESNTSGVIKASEEETKEGIQYVFLDFNPKSTDTIKISIPSLTTGELKDSTTTNTTNADIKTDSSVQKESVVVDNVRIDITEKVSTTIVTSDSSSANKTIAIPVEERTVVQDSVSNPFHKSKLVVDSSKVEVLSPVVTDKVNPIINTSCTALATNDDFIKLRRKMAGEDNDEDMISAAKKAFKAKCYTTEQIKNLGSLFLNDQARYNFFDAAYPYVSDPGSFISLEDQLIEDYYKKRFKAMIK